MTGELNDVSVTPSTKASTNLLVFVDGSVDERSERRGQQAVLMAAQTTSGNVAAVNVNRPKFCPNCGSPTGLSGNFFSNCGSKKDLSS